MGSATRSITVAPHQAVEIQADTIFDGFRDLSYAYRFGPPNHDLIVASLRRGAGDAQTSDAFLFPTGLPTHREADLGLTVSTQALGDGRYVLDIRSRRFAQSVAIDVPHFRPDDNYFHVAPHSSRTVMLHPLPSAVLAGGVPRRPVGQITPLNSALSVRITGP